MSDYSPEDVDYALSCLPIGPNDKLFIHSNIGFFGRMSGASRSDTVCKVFFDAIMKKIAPRGTLFVPTFTYSFPKGQLYDRDCTPPAGMGMFSEYVWKRHDSYRSMDPCYSVAGVGDGVHRLTRGVSDNSFGAGSFFDRFYESRGKILNMNFDAGSTFIHYVERCLNVDYRFDKTFNGVVSYEGDLSSCSQTIYVRKLEDIYIASFEEFDRIARSHNAYVTKNLGRGEIGVITADDTARIILNTINTRPYFLTKGESTSSPWQ